MNYTPLILAARSGKGVEVLIEAGASLNSLSADGSALMIASARKNNKIVRLFLEAGSNVDLVHKH